jgi:hypothetical protein
MRLPTTTQALVLSLFATTSVFAEVDAFGSVDAAGGHAVSDLSKKGLFTFAHIS